MSLIAIIAASMLAAGAPPPVQAAAPSEWRRTEMAPGVFAATAFTGEVDGVRRVTIVMRSREDREMQGTGMLFRGIVFENEVRCAERMWRITTGTHYAASYAVVHRITDVPEAPLVRETPLHAAVTDVCDGGHTGPVALTTSDVVEVQRWLDSL
jgi:hypothetical protein